MKILVLKVDNLVIPAQAHPGEDAAYDVVATSEPKIVGQKSVWNGTPQEDLWLDIQYITYETNLYLSPQPSASKCCSKEVVNYHTLFLPRSSISEKNLILANSFGLIDYGYRNQIVLRFKYYFQPCDLLCQTSSSLSYSHSIVGKINPDRIYHKGNKIAQMMVAPNIDIQFEVVSKLDDSQRQMGGFGSSGK